MLMEEKALTKTAGQEFQRFGVHQEQTTARW